MSVVFEMTADNQSLSVHFVEKLSSLLENILKESDFGMGEVNVVIGDNRLLQDLNQKYRSIDAPTDVLSFSYIEGEPVPVHEESGYAIGDIFVSYERAQEQAAEAGHNLEREIAFLTIHGMLHLLGYDHKEDSDAGRMREKEKLIIEEFDQTVTGGDLNE
ncbi:MAG: rRNA maturation RNase YbeY [Bacillota bacterium]|nr:rRNA maturation RNase YbeY [Bacillota bacterium]